MLDLAFNGFLDGIQAVGDWFAHAWNGVVNSFSGADILEVYSWLPSDLEVVITKFGVIFVGLALFGFIKSIEFSW